MEIVSAILINLATQLPILIAFIVGIIISIVTWKRNPKPSMLALIGFIILVGLTIIGSVSNFLSYFLSNSSGIRVSQIGWITTTVFTILTIIRSGAYALLIAAIFSKRKNL